jgi:hypothetical protein
LRIFEDLLQKKSHDVYIAAAGYHKKRRRHPFLGFDILLKFAQGNVATATTTWPQYED